MYLKRNKELDIISLYLGDYKKECYLREISRLTNIPLKTTQTLLANLENARIIKGETSGKNKYFKLNLDIIQTKFYILQAEIQKTISFLEKYPLLKPFVKEIKEDSAVVVFGSFARLEAKKDSDIDLLVIAKRDELPLHLLPYKTHKINISEADFENSNDAVLKEVEKNHIMLNNHSFFVGFIWKKFLL